MKEINLLPASRRTALRRQLMWRAISGIWRIVIIGLVGLTVLAGGLLLILWLLTAQIDQDRQNNLLSEVEKFKTVRDDIAGQNFVLNSLNGIGRDRLVWASWLKDLFAQVPPGVIIDAIHADASSFTTEHGPQVILRGQAPNRSIMNTFADSLRGSSAVTALEAPASNLLDRVKPKFDFTLSLPGGLSRSEEAADEAPSGSDSARIPELLPDDHPDAPTKRSRPWPIGLTISAVSAIVTVITIPIAYFRRRAERKLD